LLCPDALRGYVVVLLVVSGEMIIFENIGVGWGLAPTFFCRFSALNFGFDQTAGASHPPYDNNAELLFMSIIMNYEL